jgi:hypothetical protein
VGFPVRFPQARSMTKMERRLQTAFFAYGPASLKVDPKRT